MSRFINSAFLLLLLSSSTLFASATEEASTTIEQLDKPMYSPFIERYILDELKQIRIDLERQRVEFSREIVDREISSIDRGVRYATDTVTYFFYLIAAASSILVLVGWSSIRDIKERVHSLADEEIAKLVSLYDERLQSIESQMKQKSVDIEENREEIELTQEVQSLWLRVGRESNVASKIAIYDEILKVRPGDVEAFTYKADAVLELNEPQWAINLCQQALEIDPDCSHAFYQLACAYTAQSNFEEALLNLKKAVALSDIYKDDLLADAALKPLHNLEDFEHLLAQAPVKIGEAKEVA